MYRQRETNPPLLKKETMDKQLEAKLTLAQAELSALTARAFLLKLDILNAEETVNELKNK